MSDRFTLYQCSHCLDTFITDSKSRWDIVFCENKCSGVDDEEYYVRTHGNPIRIESSDNIAYLNRLTKEL